RVGATNRGFAEAKIDLLGRLPIRTPGAVLNAVGAGAPYYPYYYQSSPSLPGNAAAAEEWGESGAQARVLPGAEVGRDRPRTVRPGPIGQLATGRARVRVCAALLHPAAGLIVHQGGRRIEVEIEIEGANAIIPVHAVRLLERHAGADEEVNGVDRGRPEVADGIVSGAQVEPAQGFGRVPLHLVEFRDEASGEVEGAVVVGSGREHDELRLTEPADRVRTAAG